MLNFVGIGAQKAGTTWIAENLVKHPQIAFPAGKEVHFWDGHYDKGVDWYKSLFENGNLINGDITPAYAFMEIAKIKQLHKINPNLPLIFCVRNPIDRAWSAARMMLSRCEITMEEASNAWFIDLFISQGSLLRGDYIGTVDNYLSVFDEKQLLVLDFDDIEIRPNQLLQDVCKHIGADDSFFAEGEGNIIHKKVHRSIGSGEIRPSLLPVLQDIYDKQIQAMQEHPILGKIYG